MINLENVSFSYNNKVEVLSNISLKIEAGESIGIIGANGVRKVNHFETISRFRIRIQRQSNNK